MQFMERSVKAGKPFFSWVSSTRMHIWAHLRVGGQRCGRDADKSLVHPIKIGQDPAFVEKRRLGAVEPEH